MYSMFGNACVVAGGASVSGLTQLLKYGYDICGASLTESAELWAFEAFAAQKLACKCFHHFPGMPMPDEVVKPTEVTEFGR